MIPDGATVKMSYTITVNGQVIETSGQTPFEIVKGKGQIIPGIEEALDILNQGDKKRFVVGPEKAFGNRKLEAVKAFPKSSFQTLSGLREGSVVRGHGSTGSFQAVVREIRNEEVMLDFNHPLAGHTLQVELEVLQVTPPSA